MEPGVPLWASSRGNIVPIFHFCVWASIPGAGISTGMVGTEGRGGRTGSKGGALKVVRIGKGLLPPQWWWEGLEMFPIPKLDAEILGWNFWGFPFNSWLTEAPKSSSSVHSWSGGDSCRILHFGISTLGASINPGPWIGSTQGTSPEPEREHSNIFSPFLTELQHQPRAFWGV